MDKTNNSSLNDIENDTTTKAQEPIVLSQEEWQAQLQEAYTKGQKTGFVSSIKQIRSEINDYLSDLIASIKNN